MANDERIRQQVRQKLNVEKVKLWERPYTLGDGTKGSRPEVLWCHRSATQFMYSAVEGKSLC